MHRPSFFKGLLRWPTASLRSTFMAVIIVATVPVSALACYLVVQQTMAASEALETSLSRTATSFSLTIEREMVSSIDALSILSYSDSLQRDDVAGFFATLTALPKMRSSWSSAYLVDLNGEVLFDTRQPMGKRLRQMIDLQALAQLQRTGEPVVTGLIDNALGHRTTGILVPVVIQGKLRYALGAWIGPGSWQKLMTSVTLVNGGVAAVVDSHFRVVARSKEPERFIGRFMPAPAQQLMRQNASGVERMALLTGEQAYVAWERVPSAGWTIGVGVPAGPIDDGHTTSIAAALAAGVLSLIAGLALAMIVARRVTIPLRQLALDGPQAAGPVSEVRELAILQESLRHLQAQRQLAHDRLQAKADEFETLFQSSPIGLAIAQDKNCQVVLRNPALAAMFNEDAHGQLSPHKVYHEGQELAPEDQPLRRAALAGVKIDDLELEVVHADGRTLQLIAHAVPLYDSEDRPRGAIGAYTDITARKQADQALVQAERRLRESQHMVELAQEAGHVGFFDYHFWRDTTTWTSGMARLFGMEPAEFEGTWDAWIRRIDPVDQPAVQANLREATQRKHGQAIFEFRTHHPNGSVRWLSSRVVLTYDEDRLPTHMIGVVVDITQQKSVEQERAAFILREQAARVEAENANRAKDEFLAMLGHELRNPLGAIAAASEVLNRANPASDSATNARQIIARQTRHMARLMDDLLDVARVITGKIILSPRSINLADAAQRLASTLEVSGLLRDHHLQTDLHEVWISADSTRLEQVIYNLLTNALKYTPDGGKVMLTVRERDGMAELEVKDSGMGMSEALLARVFDLFVQGDRTLDRRQGGLGIGLTLVRRLIEKHGGTVTARSPGPQQGSVFTVRLPLIAPAEAPLAAAQAPADAPRRVVVVEDNTDVLEALRGLLELAGHEVATATDGEQALPLILQFQPDLALIDIGLPRLNGYDVAKHLRQAGYGGRLVALSGYGQPKDVAQAQAAGFDAHLVKPVDPDALERLVAQAGPSGH